jgi:hypothetical protein
VKNDSARETRKKREEESLLPLPETVHAYFESELKPWLENWGKKNAFPQALLWTGARGSQERAWIHTLAQWASCENAGFAPPSDQEDDLTGSLFGESVKPTPTLRANTEAHRSSSHRYRGCGDCAPCRRAYSGQSLDLVEVLPDEDEEDSGKHRSLKIDQLRALRENYGILAPGSSYRLILIPDADRMTPQAANALLKLLEEPPRGWCFMLTAPDASMVLPTILSRCLQVRLPVLSVDHLRASAADLGIAAAAHSGGAAQTLAELSFGSLERYLELATPLGQQAFVHAKNFLDKPRQNSGGILDWMSTDLNKTTLTLDLIEGLVAKNAASAPDWQRRLAERIASSRRKLETPLNRKLLLQAIILPCLDLSSPPVR